MFIETTRPHRLKGQSEVFVRLRSGRSPSRSRASYIHVVPKRHEIQLQLPGLHVGDALLKCGGVGFVGLAFGNRRVGHD